jgi:hypothetical protein
MMVAQSRIGEISQSLRSFEMTALMLRSFEGKKD